MAAIAGALLTLACIATPAHAQQNYPLEATLELRDSQGRLLSAATPTCPEDGITVHATGWSANSSVHATFHSDPVDLGNYPVDGVGALDFSFKVFNVENGLHTLRLAGTGTNGQPRTIEASILCECVKAAAAVPPVAVAGATLDSTSAFGKTDTGGGVFGKTGSDARALAVIAFDLIVVGLVLRLAVQRRRRTAGSPDR